MNESPRAISSIASVVMNGGRLSLTTGSALIQPGRAADGDGDEQRHDDQRRAAQMQRVGEQRHDDAGQRDERADREVDAGRDDDERLADAEDAVVRDLAQDVDDVARGRETSRARRR